LNQRTPLQLKLKPQSGTSQWLEVHSGLRSTARSCPQPLEFHSHHVHSQSSFTVIYFRFMWSWSQRASVLLATGPMASLTNWCQALLFTLVLCCLVFLVALGSAAIRNSRAGGGCSYTNRVKKLYVFPVWGRYVHGFLAQVILFTLEPIRIFPSSLSFHYLFTRGPRFGQANATGEDRPQKMNVHDFQLSPSVD